VIGRSITLTLMESAPAPPLLNDLYQFTVASAYLDAGIAGRRAVFELFYRSPPHGGRLAIACGIGPALDFLDGFRFGGEEIEYLRSLGMLGERLLSRLRSFRFGGDVDAVLEGTVVFPREPILRIAAPILEAQLVETPLLNLVGFATLIATKAARIAAAAGPKEVLEFGCRRAQGPDGALTASRAAFAGGAGSTSHLEAGRRFGIPVKGTMAHSYVCAFPSEVEAFRAFARACPEKPVFLIDTVNTIHSGLPAALAVAGELRAAGRSVAGVRIDSGDLSKIAPAVREGLDRAGFPEVMIFASGDLDDEKIAALETGRAPIDGYGVGGHLVTAHGDPALTAVYKLAAMEEGSATGRLLARMKWTDDPGKATLPGVKQAWRGFGESGLAAGDRLALVEEAPTEGGTFRPLLEPAFRAGRRVRPPEPLLTVKARARDSLAQVPEIHKRLRNPIPYPVTISQKLEELRMEESRKAKAGRRE
jgi:nicotinate phosphoribosyltransferase